MTKGMLGLLFWMFFSLGCGSTLCTKGKTKQGLFLDFGSEFGRSYVNLAGYPTFHSGKTGGTEKLIVDPYEGFLLVYSQGTVHCDNMDELKKGKRVKCKNHRIVDMYKVHRYTDERGYEEWGKGVIPESEWRGATQLNHQFSKKPEYHYENCRWHFFGGLFQLLEFISRA